MAERSSNGYKTLWEKEKLLVTSNFSFSHCVFKRLTLQTRKNQGLFGKGLYVGKVSDIFQPQIIIHHSNSEEARTDTHYLINTRAWYYKPYLSVTPLPDEKNGKKNPDDRLNVTQNILLVFRR